MQTKNYTLYHRDRNTVLVYDLQEKLIGMVVLDTYFNVFRQSGDLYTQEYPDENAAVEALVAGATV